MKKRYFIISGIIAYLVFVIISMPAAPVLSQMHRFLPVVSIQGISGSLWRGNAAVIRINQQYTLTNTDWDIHTWHMLTGEISAHIKTHYQQQMVDGNMAINILGTVSANNMKATMRASTLEQILRIPLAQLGGNIALDIDQLEWQQKQIPRATGHLKWDGATVTVSETATLGNIVIALTGNKKQPLHASISNHGGDIRLAGEANVSEDGKYSVSINMLPNKSAGRDIQNSLRMFAKPEPDGSYQLNNNGNLKTLGLI